ncbi:MAG: hypothetical protein IJI44_02610 [Erysipelotrichaceae bacterium]|nr:hypothetical protein [Erysipelotrichaceae bacterium]
MAKNVLKSFLFSFLLMRVLAFGVYADIAPDPVTRTIALLPVILIGVVVVLAIVLLIKFFKK